MRKLFKLMTERLEKNEALVLVTVIASSGSTPRGAGARMLVGKDGRLYGTIGGGAVEYRSEHIAAQILEDKHSGEYNFTLTKDDVQKLGMICGGAVNVYFRYIPAGDEETLKICAEAERGFEAGRDMWLLSDIKDDGRLCLYSKATGCVGFEAPDWALEGLSRRPSRSEQDGQDIYVEQINTSGKVYIFGGGHVAQELEPVLTHVGFCCVVLDDRPEFATRELFPTAFDVKLIDFEHISDYVTVGSEDYACILTRGHAFDSTVQAQMMRTPAMYIGVIGSRKKTLGVQARLREQGFTDEDFARVTTPIGLDIKAETPAEIAISIAAQMIAVRAEHSAL